MGNRNDRKSEKWARIISAALMVFACGIFGLTLYASVPPNAVTVGTANARKGPGMFHGVAATLPAGTKLTIVAKELSWFKVESGSVVGWITWPLVSVTDPAAADQYNPAKPYYEQLASYSTRFNTSSTNRNYNMELGAYKNRVVVKPGAMFSFNANTGNSTTTANGWRVSQVIINGQLEAGVGGGLCQVSSTIYSAVKQLSGIKIIERRPHSVPVGYVPVSGEAMVNYGSSDQRWRNDYSFDIYVHTEINHATGTLTTSIYRVKAAPTPNPTPTPSPIPTPTPVPTPKPIGATLDGAPLVFDVAPRNFDGRIYIELRALFEGLGYKVAYDEVTRAALMTRGAGDAMEAFHLTNGADSQVIYRVADGERTAIQIVYPIRLIEGRMLLSMRFAAEISGLNAAWDDETKTVELTSPPELTATPEPDPTPPEVMVTPEPDPTLNP
ncbi:MAG: VanW family protein [Clostridiales bacterium]|nr:VanW family protein [Clostridiales bacterium]